MEMLKEDLSEFGSNCFIFIKYVFAIVFNCVLFFFIFFECIFANMCQHLIYITLNVLQFIKCDTLDGMNIFFLHDFRGIQGYFGVKTQNKKKMWVFFQTKIRKKKTQKNKTHTHTHTHTHM